jgi:crossover junction endodeoxyribonuclease RuvC
MKVLGLDPGTRRFGWGVVAQEGTRLQSPASGTIVLPESAPLAERLVRLERELARVLDAANADAAAVESLFFAKDAQAAAKLGHARGVAILVCARAGLLPFEYPPALVKRSIAGTGRADKARVGHMVRVVLGLAATPAPDAADALAIALTHVRRAPLLQAQARAGLAGAHARGRTRGRAASDAKLLALHASRSRPV